MRRPTWSRRASRPIGSKPAQRAKITNLSEEQVQNLQSQDPEQPQKWMLNREKATWLAYNRRVDINLEPAGQESTQAYPNDVPAARILWQRAQPSLKAVESASQTSQGTQQAQANRQGN